MRDYAAERLAQRWIDGLYLEDAAVHPKRVCPVRAGNWLYGDEIPHALSWLAVRGDTVSMRP